MGKGFDFNIKVENYPYYDLKFFAKDVIKQEGFNKIFHASLDKLKSKIDESKINKDDLEIDVPTVYKNFVATALKPHLKEVEQELIKQQQEKFLTSSIDKIFWKKQPNDMYSLHIHISGQLVRC